MSTKAHRARARWLVQHHGATFAEESGITLRDKPSPLWRLLVLSMLLSTRIDAGIATASARELSRSGWRTPQRMLDSTWQQRVDALGRGGYRRYDESTATRLAGAAQLVLDRWSGDLRRMRADASGAPDVVRRHVEEVVGIGPTGSAIFVREVQQVWDEMRPFVDDRVLDGARAVGLPHDVETLAGLVPGHDLSRLAAACIRCDRDDDVASAARAVA